MKNEYHSSSPVPLYLSTSWLCRALPAAAELKGSQSLGFTAGGFEWKEIPALLPRRVSGQRGLCC
jgi:hypothetical protein